MSDFGWKEGPPTEEGAWWLRSVRLLGGLPVKVTELVTLKMYPDGLGSVLLPHQPLDFSGCTHHARLATPEDVAEEYEAGYDRAMEKHR